MAIDIKVSDSIDSKVMSKLLQIADNADKAAGSIGALVDRLSKVDSTKLKTANRAAVDASKVDANMARAAYFLAKEKVELARLKTENARTAKADADRYAQFASNTQKAATQKALDAEKIAQARMATADKHAKTATAQAEAVTKQAAANVQAQYQNQLLQYTGNWAHQDNLQRNNKTAQGQAQTGVIQARQDELLARTLVQQAKLTTEQQRAAKEAGNAALSQQRLATEQNRTATTATAAATAQQRLASATSAAQSASARANAAMAAASARLNTVRTASRSASTGIYEVGSAMSQLDRSASFLRSDGLRWAKVLWALGGATLTAHAIVDAADAYTLLQNRLTVVASSQAEVNNLTNEMFELAQRSRQPVADVAKSFQRFDMALQEMGRTQKDTIVVTETVAKALQMSGATAGESASAMLQLSQAFNKGKLDGDEFRSMMENAPLISKALAKELKVTRGELLKLAPAGKLTVEQLTNAITNAAPEINKLFDSFKWTIGQSFTYMRNEMMKFFGELDKSVGFTQGLSYAIRSFADNLDKLLFAVLAITPALMLFVGTKVIAGFGTLLAFLARTAISIGAIRSPITIATLGLINLTKKGITAGTTIAAMFASSTTRAIAFQMAIVRCSAVMAAMASIASRVGAALLAAFSFGNIILVLGTAVAALIAFGDQMIVSKEKGTTMRDYTIASFSVMAEYISGAFNDTFDAVHEGMDGVTKESLTTSEKVLISLGETADGLASFGDATLTVFRWLGQGILALVTLVMETMRNIVNTLGNIIRLMVNAVLSTVNELMRAFASAASFAGRIGNLFGGNFETNVTAPQIEMLAYAANSFEATAAEFTKMNNQNALTVDFLERGLAQFRSDVSKRAEVLAKDRKAAGELRPDDPEQAAKFKAANKADEKAKKEKKEPKSDAEKRADMVLKAMLAEEKATAIAKVYGDERERVTAVEAINTKLLEKKYAVLSAAEEGMLRKLVDTKIQAERVGKAVQSMYDEATSPAKDFASGQEAVNILLKDGVISAERSMNMMQRLADTYNEATDALYSARKALSDLNVTQGKFGVDAAIAKAANEASENAKSKGLPDLTYAQVSELEAITRATYDQQKAQEAANAVYESTQGTQEALAYQLRAVADAYDQGILSMQSYVTQIAAVKAQQGALNEMMYGLYDPIEPLRRGMYQLVSEMPTLGQGMADAIQSTLGNAIDNIADTMTSMIMNFDAYSESVAEALGKPVSTLDVLRYALSDIVKQIGTELIGAVIKLGIQWAIQAALGTALQESMAATAIATQTATAASINAAWTPAAISASIATMGSASTAGLTGYVAAQAAGKASSLGMGAFANGGEIIGAGTGRSDSIMARLSAGEHVIRADVAKKNRPMLNAMNSGREVATGNVDNSVVIYVTVDSNGNSSENSEANMTQFAKNLSGMVRQEVLTEFKRQSSQGHSMYK